MMVEKQGPTLADRRKERVAAMVCGAKGPEVARDKATPLVPVCQRVKNHDGPHRTISARDFSTTAEWERGTYTVRPK